MDSLLDKLLRVSPEIGLFLLITWVVGLVNVAISEPVERSPVREFVSYLVVVVGGITAFTTVIVVSSGLFQ